MKKFTRAAAAATIAAAACTIAAAPVLHHQ